MQESSSTGGARGSAARPRADSLRTEALRITPDDVARTARELVDTYGPAAASLMRARMRALRRRGDAETALLWDAVAEAVDRQLTSQHGARRRRALERLP